MPLRAAGVQGSGHSGDLALVELPEFAFALRTQHDLRPFTVRLGLGRIPKFLVCLCTGEKKFGIVGHRLMGPLEIENGRSVVLLLEQNSTARVIVGCCAADRSQWPDQSRPVLVRNQVRGDRHIARRGCSRSHLLWGQG